MALSKNSTQYGSQSDFLYYNLITHIKRAPNIHNPDNPHQEGSQYPQSSDSLSSSMGLSLGNLHQYAAYVH